MTTWRKPSGPPSKSGPWTRGNWSVLPTDNGVNIVAAVRKLGWKWLNCFGHNLHLAVTNAMKTEKGRTARAIGVCRTLVAAFSQSWQKKRKLQKEQAELNMPQHCLVLVSCAKLLFLFLCFSGNSPWRGYKLTHPKHNLLKL